mgnify:CR=1 FL=1
MREGGPERRLDGPARCAGRGRGAHWGRRGAVNGSAHTRNPHGGIVAPSGTPDQGARPSGPPAGPGSGPRHAGRPRAHRPGQSGIMTNAATLPL